jgi:hypothetical protein
MTGIIHTVPDFGEGGIKVIHGIAIRASFGKHIDKSKTS